QAQHEVAHHEGPHHVGNPLHAARRDQAILPVEELQEGAVDVVPPAQHEVHQERDERRHQQHLVQRAQPRIDVIADRRGVFVNPYFGDGSRRRRLRPRLHRRGALLTLLCGRQRLLLLPPALFFLTLARRDQNLVSLVLHAVNLLLDPVHHLADALPVLRQLVVKARQLRISPQPDHVEQRQRERTHHEARQRTWEAYAHQSRHERFQYESDSQRDQRGDKEEPPE